MRKYFVDYRFIVTAKSKHEASKKVLDFLPEATNSIWYTIDKICDERIKAR